MSRLIGRLRGAMMAVALAVLAGGWCAGGCQGGARSGAAAPGAAVDESGRTLYDRLGGRGNIRLVVDDFVNRAVADPRVNFFRRGEANEWKPTPKEIEQFKEGLVDFFVQATGGPAKYRGRPMPAVHAGMAITDRQFDLAAEHLRDAIQKYNVDPADERALMEIAAGTREDIVDK